MTTTTTELRRPAPARPPQFAANGHDLNTQATMGPLVGAAGKGRLSAVAQEAAR
jgi:hypothetical protein